jgi:Ser/Thr protein kinase RdoA (MazF antagonist)
VSHSTFLEADIVHLIAAEYRLGTPDQCSRLGGGINESYAVDIDEHRYVLRIYGRDKFWIAGESDLRFEVDLLIHLHEQGVPVSYPLPRRNGDRLGQFSASEAKEDFYALFTWAPRARVETESRQADQAHLVGRTLASIHLAAEHFQTEHRRYALDEGTLLDWPLQQLEPYLSHAVPTEGAFIMEQVAQLRTLLLAFNPGPGGWGIIHGDVHGGNHHFTEDGQITFFDFDHCGYGWRAYDLSYYYTRIQEPLRASCLEGYNSVRPLGHAERGMLTPFGQAAWMREAGGWASQNPRPSEEERKGLLAELARMLSDPYL